MVVDISTLAVDISIPYVDESGYLFSCFLKQKLIEEVEGST
jgi:hypothetical protein